ncbi:contact-dependent growth inhibition system immunity protein [Paenibacillus foliorum]|uniref:contact-dependent growth inhibition system immunity protein n=1 Tax=Paenibacillus foliorum TaxID=2654974 RepID=UPI001492C70D
MEAPTHSTGLIRKVHELRKLPLKYWTNEDLRLIILQQRSLGFLLPIVLYRLARDPFCSGNLYAGDLLNAVVSIDEDFWKCNEYS